MYFTVFEGVLFTVEIATVATVTAFLCSKVGCQIVPALRNRFFKPGTALQTCPPASCCDSHNVVPCCETAPAPAKVGCAGQPMHDKDHNIPVLAALPGTVIDPAISIESTGSTSAMSADTSAEASLLEPEPVVAEDTIASVGSITVSGQEPMMAVQSISSVEHRSAVPVREPIVIVERMADAETVPADSVREAMNSAQGTDIVESIVGEAPGPCHVDYDARNIPGDRERQSNAKCSR